MYHTPRIDEAVKLAARLHRDHTRKDAGSTPYISHLVSVSMILSESTDDEDIIIAGLLHDSLEDVPNYTYENLVRDCGLRIAGIVKQVTEPLDPNKQEYEQLPWLTRKNAYLDTLKKGGVESAMVSAADKIHNTDSFIMDILREGEAFISRFGSSLRDRLWFHEEVLIIIEGKLGKNHILTVKLASCTEKFRSLVAAHG